MIAGAALALTTLGGLFTEARTFAALLAALAVAQLVQAVRHKKQP